VNIALLNYSALISIAQRCATAIGGEVFRGGFYLLVTGDDASALAGQFPI
jgi:hypothetical protein